MDLGHRYNLRASHGDPGVDCLALQRHVRRRRSFRRPPGTVHYCTPDGQAQGKQI